jgi:hypothetical protein
MEGICIELEPEIKYTGQEINNMRNVIENMNKFNQIEILRILQNGNVTLNENNYGVFINLSNVNSANLTKLINYIKYVDAQEQNLNNIEKQKEDYINTYFSKDIKDNTGDNDNSDILYESVP